MRILMLAQTYAPVIGGEERHVQNLGRQLARKGHSVHVATQALDDSPTLEVDEDGVSVHRLSSLAAKLPAIHANPERPHSLPVPDPILTGALSRLVRRIEPDVVHAHNWIVNSFLPLQRRSRHPLLMSLHSYEHRCATTRLMRGEEDCDGPGVQKCLSCSAAVYGPGKGPMILAGTWLMKPWKERLIDRFLPVSRAVAARTGLDQSRVDYEVVPNFVPDALLAARASPAGRPSLLPGDDYLLFVGDLTGDKGVETVLHAYASMSAPKPRLVLVGRATPSMPDVLPDGVVVGTDWPHERVIAAFQHALAAVLPSRWADPCPTTVLEAMALGVPLVTTAVGGIVDMVDEKSAVLVQPNDVGQLREAMVRVTEDRKFGEAIAEAAAARVGDFTASAVGTQVERVYEEVLSARATAPLSAA